MHKLQVYFAQQPPALKQTELKRLSTTKSPKCGEGGSFAHAYSLCATSICVEAGISEQVSIIGFGKSGEGTFQSLLEATVCLCHVGLQQQQRVRSPCV